MFGFLNIYKPSGLTSFDIVAKLRKVTNIRQIGHTGTLDPFATGVLPVCIGKSTKLIEYLPDDKEYIATVKFGVDTDTYDKDGQIVKTYENIINRQQLEDVLVDFEGEIEQFPPKYSAIKVKGKKLYEYARRGQEVEIKPRKVFISKIKLLDFDQNNQVGKVIVACSKGTYIRSIAYDIGQKLSCGGHLIALERTKAGAFSLSSAVNLENITTVQDVENNLINPLDVLSQEKYELNESEKDRVIHGVGLYGVYDSQSVIANSNVVFLVYSGKIIAAGIKNDNDIKIKKVFEVL